MLTGMSLIYHYSAPDSGCIVMSVSVCVRVCLSANISSELHVLSLRNFVHVTYGRDSVGAPLTAYMNGVLPVYG